MFRNMVFSLFCSLFVSAVFLSCAFVIEFSGRRAHKTRDSRIGSVSDVT